MRKLNITSISQTQPVNTVKVKNVWHQPYLPSSCQQDLFGLWRAWFDLAKQFRSLSVLHTKTTRWVWQRCNSVTLELLVGGRVTIWARRAPRVSQFSLDTHASHLSWAGMSYLNHLLFSEELMVSVKCSQRSVSMTFPFTTGGWDFRSKKHWHLLYLNNQMRMKWSYLSRQKGIATQVLTQHWSSLDISLTAGIQGSVKDKHCFWKRYDHCYSSHIQRNAIHLGKTIFRL